MRTNKSLVGAGTIVGCFVCWWSDPVTVRLSAKHPKKRAEYLRLPLACIGGPIFVVSILWFGFTARDGIHWAVPFVALFPYGIAYNIIWVAMINVSYLITADTRASGMTNRLFSSQF